MAVGAQKGYSGISGNVPYILGAGDVKYFPGIEISGKTRGC